jgi:hypothetical protein
LETGRCILSPSMNRHTGGPAPRRDGHRPTHRPMSAIGPKRTSLVAPHMSAFRGKADMSIWACLLLRSLLGVKRTWVGALHMSAFDPKRTLAGRHLPLPSDLLCCNYRWQRAGLGTATCAGEISSKLLLDRRLRARIWRARSKTDE